MSNKAKQRTCEANPTARDVLRQATQAAHDRLHRNRLLAPLSSGDIDLEQYRIVLGRLAGFHLPLEAKLVSAAEILGVAEILAPRLRSAQLFEDLRFMGLEADIERIPTAAFDPITDIGVFFGAFYVREGSTLGGKYLASRLDHLFADERGRRFLTGSDDDSELWRRLTRRIDEVGTSVRLPSMVVGATETFAAMESWLDDA